jgi:hypothetical protein
MSEAEAYIRSQLEPQLRPGEQIVSCAILSSVMQGGVLSALSLKGYLAALTNVRIILIETRVGAFKPTLENKGIQSIELHDIDAVISGNVMKLRLRDGTTLEYQQRARAKKHAPSHPAFIAALTEAYGHNELATQMAKESKRQNVIGILIALVFMGVFGFGRHYLNKAEVEVVCSVTDEGFDCVLNHVGGGAGSNVCWSVVLTCANGHKPEARPCGYVDRGGQNTVQVAEDSFGRIDECDQVTSASVENLVLTVD